MSKDSINELTRKLKQLDIEEKRIIKEKQILHKRLEEKIEEERSSVESTNCTSQRK